MIVQTRTLALVALDDTINDISKKFICDIQEAGARLTKNPWLAKIKKLK